MKALPSIAFNEFRGSVGDVTARVSKGRQVLSARTIPSKDDRREVRRDARYCEAAVILKAF